VYIAEMARKKVTSLQEWMKVEQRKDADLAPVLEISRVQVSRLRRKVNGASRKTALKLEQLTGIPWHNFIGPGAAA
jgi:plasmid maintenance system antidote protein VapI